MTMSKKEKKSFDYKNIRKKTWHLVFGKGFGPWLSLVTVGFIFAFIGVSNTSQVQFINLSDSLLDLQNEFLPNNTQILEGLIDKYAASLGAATGAPETVSAALNLLTRSQTWLIKLLGANLAYVQRNEGEVIAALLISALVASVIHFVLQNLFVCGQYRYVMENHVDRQVRIMRIFAPFHRENIWNMLKVRLKQTLVLVLWGFTIIGGIYKYYQYIMVPYILTENPNISWKDAKRISAKMTDGHKMHIFLLELSVFYMYLIELIPVAGILVTVPFRTQMMAEVYFDLREQMADEREFFIERAFDGPCYEEGNPEHVPYLMGDHVIETPQEMLEESGYRLTHYIIMFFVFSMIGWIWEVTLHLVQYGEFVNRGTMYGPWLPIYGTGGVLMIFLLNRYRDNVPKLVALMLVVCGALEYLSSLMLDFVYNASYWDYKDMFLNLNGRICVAGLVAFAIGGCFGIYVAGPKLKQLVDRFAKKKQIILCAVLVVLYLIDKGCCMVFGFNKGSGVGESLSVIIECCRYMI